MSPNASTSASGFTHVGDELIYDGFVIRVVNGVFTTPDGERIQRDIVRHPGAVGVVALDGDDVVLVRQYRPAIDDHLLEIPAGKRDVDGEPPERTAVRELEEEVGLRPATIESIGGMHCSVGFCDEYIHLFLATDFESVPTEHDGPEERHMTVERWSLDEVAAALSDGRITDAKSLVALGAVLRRLGR